MDERVVRVSVCPWCGEKVASADGRFIHEGRDGFRHVWADDEGVRQMLVFPMPRSRSLIDIVDDDSWRAKLKERLEYVKD